MNVQVSNEEKLAIKITSDEMDGVLEWVRNVLNADGASDNHEEMLYLEMMEQGLSAVEAASVFGWWEISDGELRQDVQDGPARLELYEDEWYRMGELA